MLTNSAIIIPTICYKLLFFVSSYDTRISLTSPDPLQETISYINADVFNENILVLQIVFAIVSYIFFL